MTKKDVGVAAIGAASLIYLINPGLGIFEFLPDSLPVVGNVDEAFATFLVISSLSYFGLDLRRFFIRNKH